MLILSKTLHSENGPYKLTCVTLENKYRFFVDIQMYETIRYNAKAIENCSSTTKTSVQVPYPHITY